MGIPLNPQGWEVLGEIQDCMLRVNSILEEVEHVRAFELLFMSGVQISTVLERHWGVLAPLECRP